MAVSLLLMAARILCLLTVRLQGGYLCQLSGIGRLWACRSCHDVFCSERNRLRTSLVVRLALFSDLAPRPAQVRLPPDCVANSKNGLQRFREKRNQAKIANQYVLKRATEVAGGIITWHDYSIAAPTARKICLIQKEFCNTIPPTTDTSHCSLHAAPHLLGMATRLH